MTNITLSVPQALYKRMRKHEDIKWSSVARSAIEKKLADLDMMDRLVAKSRMTAKGVDEISDLIDSRTLEKVKAKCG